MSFFNFWQIFSMTKLKMFFKKATKSLQNCLNSKLVMISISENGFEATLGLENGILFLVTKLKLFSRK